MGAPHTKPKQVAKQKHGNHEGSSLASGRRNALARNGKDEFLMGEWRGGISLPELSQNRTCSSWYPTSRGLASLG